MGAVPDTGDTVIDFFFSLIHVFVELTFWLGQMTSDSSLRSDGSVMQTNKTGKGACECWRVGWRVAVDFDVLGPSHKGPVDLYVRFELLV